ncbi:hypothetical protein AGMMS50249_1090 [candidate division SR1 bacterium]|nr:hypothetical protein AGMMS50249_1090 [candidate division SR1 bacterium]
MNKYELVLMLNVSVAEKDRKTFLDELEKKFKMLDKDDIGIKDLSFKLKDKSDKAYFVSYLFEGESNLLAEIKQSLLYNPNVIRYEIFSRDENAQFFHFETLQKTFEAELEKLQDKRYGKKLSFFTKKENEQYLDRKAVSMLKKYQTRFGDIKPRIYTGNSVKVQKKLRVQIIRARSLGFLPFIKH